MIKKTSIAKVVMALLCLVFAFALVIFPPSSAHAAAGVHGGHSAVPKSEAASQRPNHSHVIALQADCGGHVDASTSNAGTPPCCAGVCSGAILIEEFASLQVDASKFEPVVLKVLFFAADDDGVLRPPKHLI